LNSLIEKNELLFPVSQFPTSDIETTKVDILLAACNGEKFIKKQLESLLKQSHKNWCLLIRDDGSNDNTFDIISAYGKRYPARIKLFPGGSRLGPCQNFNWLLQQSSSGYVMFCDQDDIWLPDKIKLSLETMQRTEKNHPDLPVLVHTDLKIIDENDKIITDSFWKAIRLNPDDRRVLDLLGTSNTNGNTILMNRKLARIINSIPRQAIMHDWWSAIVAAQFGLIVPLKKATVLYRQHSKNAVGAISILRRLPQTHRYLYNIYLQIREFEKIYNLRYSIPKIYFYKIFNLSKNYLTL
jgi:glycosyltransferase involved in cell wall biosynthesis